MLLKRISSEMPMHIENSVEHILFFHHVFNLNIGKPFFFLLVWRRASIDNDQSEWDDWEFCVF